MPRRKNLALKDIRKHQTSTDYLIPAAPFRRLVAETIQNVANENDLCIQQNAVNALQTEFEAYGVDLLRKANLIAISQGRETLLPEDINLLSELLK